MNVEAQQNYIPLNSGTPTFSTLQMNGVVFLSKKFARVLLTYNDLRILTLDSLAVNVGYVYTRNGEKLTHRSLNVPSLHTSRE